MSQIEQTICEAVDILVNRAISQAQFDKTIKGLIVSLVDSVSGKYKVRYQGDLLYAYAGTADMEFKVGDEVYILVPQGDFSGDKTILGTTRKLGESVGETVLPENERYETIGNNVLPETNEFRVCSYDAKDKRIETVIKPKSIDGTDSSTDIMLYKAGAGPSSFPIDNAALKQYLQSANYLVLSATLATNLVEAQQYQGNYGVEFCLRFATAQDGIYEDRIYKIDVNNIYGFPWDLGIDGVQQYFYFEVPSEKFVGVQSVKIFAENFPAKAQTGQTYNWDIWIKNLSLTAANKISDDDLNSYFVRLVTKNGSHFSNIDTSDKTIEAIVYEKGAEVTTQSKLKYYWFYQRADVTTTHPNYCSYGGEGWYCLNEVEEVKDDNENIIRRTWQPSTNTLTVKKTDVITEKRKYKCVVLYDNTQIEKEVLFTRDDVEWSISLATTTGATAFFRDEGSTSINCTIYDNLEPILDSEKCQFKWLIQNYAGQATLSEETSRSLEVPISSILYQSTFVCSAFIDNEYIGTDTISLTNTGEDLNVPLYELILINGNRVFKYDEDGISPSSKAQESPETIPPLKLAIFDNKKGEQLGINEKDGAAANVQIYVPNSYSLLEPNGNKDKKDGDYDVYSYPSTGFSFDVNDRYNVNYTNNNIKVVVTYNKVTLVGYTDFIFIKEGENGTNGTNYVCRIVPNLKTGDYSARDWISWTNNANGARSYNFAPKDKQVPFTVKLLDGNTEIAGNSIIWSSLARKYDSSHLECSLFSFAQNATPTYNGWTDTSAPRASIMQAKVTDTSGNIFYATLPLVDIQRKNFNYTFAVKGGFKEVVYEADGTRPKYDSSEPFSIAVTDSSGAIVSEGLTYQWSSCGELYEEKNGTAGWRSAELLKQDYNDKTTTGINYLVRPASTYDGVCLSTGVQCVVSLSGSELATIFIPIHFHLNRFGHAALNDWNGNDISITEEDGIILSPQIGAGQKDKNNAFTGMVMGAVKYNSGTTKNGLIGLNKGAQTIFLSAEDGSATFGSELNGQIKISPSSDGKTSAKIEGGGYSTSSKSGLMIDLSEPTIKYGSGNFIVDENGCLTAKGATIKGSFRATGDDDDVFEVQNGDASIYFGYGDARIEGKNLEIDLQEGRLSFNKEVENESEFSGYISPEGFYFGSEYVENKDGSTKGGSIRYEDGTLSISGSFNAETGSIGGWGIADKELYSKGQAIRLFSGDDEDSKNTIPAFISVSGAKSEIASSDGKKAALRKGGLYLYSSNGDLDEDFDTSNWQGRIYTNSKFDNALTISSQGDNPIYFWGSNLQDTETNENGEDTIKEVDSLVMTIQPAVDSDKKFVRIGRSKSHAEKLTTLYPNKISVKDIDILATLSTKAKTVAGAINEIYPGGPMNIQHAVVVLPKDESSILFNYHVAAYTQSHKIGYEAQPSAIIAQGYKIGTVFSYINSSRPLAELMNEQIVPAYRMMTGKFFISVQENDDEYGICEVNSIYSEFLKAEVSSSPTKFLGSQYFKTTVTFRLYADGKRVYPGSKFHDAEYAGDVVKQPEVQLFYLSLTAIYPPSSTSDYNLYHCGYVQGNIFTSSASNSAKGDYDADLGYSELSYLSTLGDALFKRVPIYIPFATQDEFEAAVNLKTVDQELYKITQTQTAS